MTTASQQPAETTQANAVPPQADEQQAAVKFQAKVKKYRDFFTVSKVYLDIENAQEKRLVERELRLNFQVKADTFLNNKIECVIWDDKASCERLRQICRDWKVTFVSVPQFKNAMVKYFSLGTRGGNGGQQIALRPLTIASSNQNHSRTQTTTSYTTRVPPQTTQVEFKHPFIMISDSSGRHRPLHKEYCTLIKFDDKLAVTKPIAQLPFLGMSFLCPSQAGGSPFHHVYEALPFPDVTKVQSLIDTSGSGPYKIERFNYKALTDIPSIFAPRDLAQVATNNKRVTRKSAVDRVRDRDNDRMSQLVVSHLQKKQTAADYLFRKANGCVYPRYEHAKQRAEAKPPAGYCECCAKRYEDLEEHLGEECHYAFAHDHENYEAVDELIWKKDEESQVDIWAMLRDIVELECNAADFKYVREFLDEAVENGRPPDFEAAEHRYRVLHGLIVESDDDNDVAEGMGTLEQFESDSDLNDKPGSPQRLPGTEAKPSEDLISANDDEKAAVDECVEVGNVQNDGTSSEEEQPVSEDIRSGSGQVDVLTTPYRIAEPLPHVTANKRRETNDENQPPQYRNNTIAKIVRKHATTIKHTSSVVSRELEKTLISGTSSLTVYTSSESHACQIDAPNSTSMEQSKRLSNGGVKRKRVVQKIY